jgi:ABC-2 type transport system permease protein
LRKSWAIFVRDARIALAYPMSFCSSWISLLGAAVTFYFISKLVGPSSAFGIGGRVVPYFDYVALNLAFVRFQNVAIHSYQQAMRGAQMLGTVEAMLVTPTGLPLLVLSSGLWAFALTIAQIVFFLGAAALLGLNLSHVDVAATVAFLILTVLAMSPIGVLSAASIMTFKQEAPTALLVGGAASLLGGVLFPVSRLPSALQALSWLLPLTHSLNGLRGAVEGATFWQLRGDALWLSCLTLALLPISLYVFARAVRRAKIDGTLGDY